MKKYLHNFKLFTLALALMLTASVVNAADRFLVVNNGNWNSITSWSATSGGAGGASVPGSGDVAIIQQGRNVNVTAAAAASSVRFFTGGGTITVNATFTLAVTTSITLENPSTGDRTATLTGAGTITCASIVVGGSFLAPNLTGDGNTDLISTIATLTVSGDVSLRGVDDVNDDNDPTFNLQSGSVTVGGSLILNEDVGSAVEFSLNGGGAETGTLNLSGATPFTVTGSPVFNANGTSATVNLSGAAQSLFPISEAYTNLTFSGTGTKTILTGTTVTVNGTLSLTTTAVTPITLAGTGVLAYAASAILAYNGSAAQTTTNVEFPAAMSADLVINNAAGVTLNGTKTLSAPLSLTSGILTTTLTNLLIMPDNFATVNGGSNTSYISGPVQKVGNEAYTFKVGKAGLYSPLTISAPDNSVDAFRVEYRRESGAALGGISAPGLSKVSNCEYWDLDEIADGGAAATSISVTVGWFPTSGCGPLPYVTDITTLTLAHFDEGATNQWNTFGGTFNGGSTNATGTVTRAAVNTFSPFTLGGTSVFSNPLPVNFSDVKAFEKGTGVQIEWTNLTEKDVLTYTVERSANGRDFTAISQIGSRSNQSDKQSYLSFDASPSAGTNYYRIKAVEIDGKVILSKLLKVDIGRNVKGISVYPNPVVGNDITIGFTAVKGQYTLRVINNAGQEVYSKQLVHPGGSISQSVELPASLKTGVYNLMISGDNYRETKMFIMQ